MPYGDKTRKKRIIAPGPKQCHPKTPVGSPCLPESKLKEVGKKLGAPGNIYGNKLVNCTLL